MNGRDAEGNLVAGAGAGERGTGRAKPTKEDKKKRLEEAQLAVE